MTKNHERGFEKTRPTSARVLSKKAWLGSSLTLYVAAFLALGVASFASSAAAAEFDVYKTPWCGCCSGWVDDMVANGHSVIVNDLETLDSIKQMAGVPEDLQACHTALVEGYVIEGHVPAADIARLLAERPEATGLAVAGMPMGAPGMGGEPEPYDVVLFSDDGTTSVYAQY
ncbi:CopG protein [hydrothermal vent metagenome]|uniref:CopG protein n=1 Tax=hydrothermal vent metagenome TaxID=652676 RepID=A0A3B0URA9_9ZZZZ